MVDKIFHDLRGDFVIQPLQHLLTVVEDKKIVGD